MRKLLLFIFSLFTLSSIAQSKYTISGYVTDKETGESLIGANVYAPITKLGTSTNASGFYSMTEHSGKVRLVFTYIGYNSVDTIVDLKKNLSLSIKMQPSKGKELATVVVTGDRQSEFNNIEVGKSKLSMQTLEQIPSLTGEADLLRYAQLLPGVAKGYEGFSGMIVRGGNVDENLYLIDGNPMYNVNHLFGLYSTFNSNAIKNVDLYKGSFPARYGGRLSSVLDVRTKDGDMQKYHGAISVGLLASALTFEGPIKKNKTSFHISLRRTYLDLLVKGARIFIKEDPTDVEKPDYYFYDLNVKINHKFNERNRIYLTLYGGADVFSIEESSKGDNSIDKTNAGMKWGNQLAALGWGWMITPKLFAHTTATFSRYKSKVYFDDYYENKGAFKEQSSYALKSGILDYGLRTDFDYRPNMKHFIRFGYDYLYHTFYPNTEQSNYSNTDETSSGMAIPLKLEQKIYSNDLSVYAEDEISWLPNFTTNIGARFTMFHVQGKTYFGACPRISARWEVAPHWNIKGAYSDMMQSVHLLQGSILSLPTDLWVPSTKKLPPMRAHQFNLGVYWKKGIYEASLEGYYKKMNNLIAYKDGESVVVSRQDWEDRVGLGKGTAYGAELLLRKTQGKLTGWVAYTLSWTKRDFNTPQINLGKPFWDRFDNRHKLNIAMIWQAKKHLSLSAIWTYSTGNRVTLPLEKFIDINGDITPFLQERNNYQMPDYHRLDLGLNWYRPKKKGRMGIWHFGVYNAYLHHNTFMLLDMDVDEGRNDNKPRVQSISFFPIIPSVSYTYKF